MPARDIVVSAGSAGAMSALVDLRDELRGALPDQTLVLVALHAA